MHTFYDPDFEDDDVPSPLFNVASLIVAVAALCGLLAHLAGVL